ncbi:hypothetical protein [Desulfobacula sp.]|uniref:hypothetical protein n=1 Tax=Desulfobacula sp. TaxID=2593537 RepID=UPI002638BA85|nr:hypothetical protein [Desulfobacula sp.]
MNRFFILRKFICTLLAIIAVGIFMTSAGYAALSASGDVTPYPYKNWISTNMYIGFSDTGTLSITDGDTLTNYYVYVGFRSESNGSVTVDGVGSEWTVKIPGTYPLLHVGYQGHGTLSILNKGFVMTESASIGSEPGSSGIVTVNGEGSTWQNSGSISVGFSGTGLINILNGASVSISGVTYMEKLGKISFGGNDGTLTTGMLYTGAFQLSGTGTINTSGIVADEDIILNNSNSDTQTFQIDNVTINLNQDISNPLGVGYRGEGRLIIMSGVSVASSDGYLGYNSDATGTATVDGEGATWSVNDGYLHVGHNGSGTLLITNGGSMTNTYSAYLGHNLDTHGRVTVNGEGSTWNSGGLYVGETGTGILSVSDNGLVTSLAGYVGNNPNSNGTVTVDGEGSTWNSGILYVGHRSSGTLSVINSGSVISSAANLGYNADASGMVIVNGEASTWTANGSLNVGYNGNGTISITDGGSVTSTATKLGLNSDSIGVATIDGEGSTWNLFGINVGLNGAGTLSITNGGSLVQTSHKSSFSIGSQSGSVGAVTVNGEGSTCDGGLHLTIGYSGIGTLTLTEGGFVRANDVNIFSGSTLTVDTESFLNVGYYGRLKDGTIIEDDWRIGDISNEGTVRLVADTGVIPGIYTPMAYGTMAGAGIVQTLGGIWDAIDHTITVTDNVMAQGIGGATVTLDLAVNQRVLVTDADSGNSVDVGFLGTDTSVVITLAVGAVSDDDLDLLRGLLSGTSEKILSAWNFSTLNYTVSSDNPAYLSLDAYSTENLSNLTIWYLVDGAWAEYKASDLAFDGIDASFVATSLSAYAVTATILGDLDGDGILDEQDKCPNTPAGANVYDDGCIVIKGDLNNDKRIGLEDSQLGFKVITFQQNSADTSSDVNDDGKIDLKDTIYIIQHIKNESGE